MTPIINSSFNKHPMSWKLIHRSLLHPSNSVIKEMFHNQTLNVLPKQNPKKLNKSPCAICYTGKMITLPKGKKVDTGNFNQDK